LLDAGIVDREKRGSFAYFSLRTDALEHLRGLLAQPADELRETVRAK
jgi:DNA-binding transcriptional ArsR family regulator